VADVAVRIEDQRRGSTARSLRAAFGVRKRHIHAGIAFALLGAALAIPFPTFADVPAKPAADSMQAVAALSGHGQIAPPGPESRTTSGAAHTTSADTVVEAARPSPGATQPGHSAAIQTRDDLGRTVTLVHPARRAITLSPHATELVYAAGAGGYLVGTVNGSNFPPAASKVASIGDGVRPSIETIAALAPDLVIAWLPGAAQGIEPFLQRAGVAVFYSRPALLADVPDDIEKLGALFATSAQAHATAAAMRTRLAELTARYNERSPVRVFIQISRIPLISLNRQSIVSDAVRVCGGVNVFADAFGVAPRISPEAAVASRPQVILTGIPDSEAAKEALAWRELAPDPTHPPVVLAFDPDVLYRPGPRLLDLTAKLCKDLDRVRAGTP
jgi:vitamin B12 transport system substrate-binding protein